MKSKQKLLIGVITVLVIILIGLLVFKYVQSNGNISQDRALQQAIDFYSEDSPGILDDYNIVLNEVYPDGWSFISTPKNGEEVEGGYALLISNQGEIKVMSSGCWDVTIQTVAEYQPCI